MRPRPPTVSPATAPNKEAPKTPPTNISSAPIAPWRAQGAVGSRAARLAPKMGAREPANRQPPMIAPRRADWAATIQAERRLVAVGNAAGSGLPCVGLARSSGVCKCDAQAAIVSGPKRQSQTNAAHTPITVHQPTCFAARKPRTSSQIAPPNQVPRRVNVKTGRRILSATVGSQCLPGAGCPSEQQNIPNHEQHHRTNAPTRTSRPI